MGGHREDARRMMGDALLRQQLSFLDRSSHPVEIHPEEAGWLTIFKDNPIINNNIVSS